MLSAYQRGVIGASARLFHLKSASICLSSKAGPLPLLRTNGLVFTTPAVPKLAFTLHNFSTSSILCYDEDILSEVIHTSTRSFKPKKYFIDLKEDNQGKRYLKLTEKSNGKKAGKCIAINQ